MSNILRALQNIYDKPENKIMPLYGGLNRINNVGNALEEYVKDSFAGTIGCTEIRRRESIDSIFAYLADQNHPPDFIIKGGDAIEVKKLTSTTSNIALNSSYPKQQLFRDDPRITQACKDCDGGEWVSRDILYVIGVVKETSLLKHIFFIYGACFAADKSKYLELFAGMKDGIKRSIGGDFDLINTNEIAKINKVDPLKLTDFRARGIWHIKNPYKTFQDIYQVNEDAKLNVACLMTEDKFNSYNVTDREALLQLDGVSCSKEEIKSPDDPNEQMRCVLLQFSIPT